MGITKSNLALPTVDRFGGCLVSFKDEWIFSLAGEKVMDNEMYSIEYNSWHPVPSLNKERADASSCEHGDFIYTFGGLKSVAGYQLADIEIFNAAKFIKDTLEGKVS